jgi:dihydropteroate synthase
VTIQKRNWEVMGILNTTPDSFFDGGNYSSPSKAVDRAAQIINEGGTIIDIGGESTRPGSSPVLVSEELDRVVPVVEAVANRFDVTISVDTTKSEVARLSFDAGANWLNDISAGRFDKKMADITAEAKATVILMHSRKKSKDMQENPSYSEVVNEVLSELMVQVKIFVNAGVLENKIILDPGIGFAKRDIDNLALINSCDQFVKTGFPLLIGTSQKSFLGRILDDLKKDRLAGSLATIGKTYEQGASIFRVHQVAHSVNYLKTIDALA